MSEKSVQDEEKSESIESTDEEKSVESVEPQIDSISSAALCDQFTAEDALGFECYVNAIAEFLTDSGTDPPLTISIEGKWGTGKSSFMAQLEKTLKDSDNLTVSFNAWRHDKEDSMWAAFAIDFLHQIASQQKFYHRWTGHFKLFLQRLNWKNKLYVIRSLTLWAAFIVFTVAAFILVILKGLDQVDLLITEINGNMWETIILGLGLSGGAAASIGLMISLWMKFKDIMGNPLNMDINKYIQSPDYENRISFIENFHKDFENIVKAYAGEKNVFVFIDDLDRCEIPKAADMMQAINLMISPDSQLIFIIGMDREKVAASIAVKHEKLLPYLFSLKSINAGSQNSANEKSPQDTTTSESVNTAYILYGLEYGYEFIEKFIQLPFLVPQPTESELDNFLKSFSEPKESIQKDSSRLGIRPKQISEDYLKKILAKLKDYMGRIGGTKNGDQTGVEPPENIPVINQEEHKKEEIDEKMRFELGKGSTRVRSIAKMVAPALDNNPRRIKQFINLFRLRAFIAIETGLLDTTGKSSAKDLLTLEQLGKFVAISLKWPLFIIHLDANRSLMEELQQAALNPDSAESNYWSRDEKFMDLLRAGCFKETDTSFDPKKNCNLSTVNVDRLLQVSPKSYTLKKPSDIIPDYEQTIHKVKEKKYLFCWDEIPGNDKGKLIEFLKQKFGINWVKTAEIEKIDNNKTIKVSTEINHLSLSLNDEETKVDLKIDDDRTYEFIAKTENGKLNIYEKKTFINNMEFVLIQSGEFDMGSSANETGRFDDEGPVHHVTISEAFYLGKYEVTQKQWHEVMGNNPSYFEGDDLPVENVSWDDVQEYIKKLNEKEGTNKYRLPTEAEWEYAARAGTTTRYSFGDDDSKLGEYAWYSKNLGDKPHPVGKREANPWGLYDVHGNVWEWVQDEWHDTYNGAPNDGSAWEDGVSAARVFRGGGWFSDARYCRSANRYNAPGDRARNLGFRLLQEM